MPKQDWRKNPIFIYFGYIFEPSLLPKANLRRSKIDVDMGSKFDNFLKASWNAIFSTKKRQGCARGAPRASAGRNARIAWGGFKEG